MVHLSEVYQLYVRHTYLSVALVESDKPYPANRCHSVRLYTRCSGAQKYFGVEYLCQKRSCRFCRIMRHSIGLAIRSIVLFVDHYQPQVSERQEKGRPCSYHYAAIGSTHFVPHLDPLRIIHSRMVDQQFIADDTFESCYKLSCQPNLGHKVEHAFAFLQFFQYEVDINFGLPRRGNSKQKSRPTLGKNLLYGFYRLLLLHCQCLRLFAAFVE